MSERNGWRHPGLFIALSIITVLTIIGGSLFFLGYFVTRLPTAYYFPFFPFGIFWAFLLIFLVFGVLRWVFWGWGWGYRRRGYYWRYDRAHQILRERYARGEITREQLDQMTRDLDKEG